MFCTIELATNVLLAIVVASQRIETVEELYSCLIGGWNDSKSATIRHEHISIDVCTSTTDQK